MRKTHLAAAVLAILGSATTLVAQEVRYVKENGKTYRETRSTIHRPVVETTIQERQETVYQEQYRTELQDRQRTVYQPQVEYRWVPKVKNRWNPFAQPRVEYHFVPCQVWKLQQEQYQVPVTTRELVPQTRVVRTPVTKQRIVEEQHITRVAINTDREPQRLDESGAAASVANRNAIGGQRLESDPPRQGNAIRGFNGLRR